MDHFEILAPEDYLPSVRKTTRDEWQENATLRQAQIPCFSREREGMGGEGERERERELKTDHIYSQG